MSSVETNILIKEWGVIKMVFKRINILLVLVGILAITACASVETIKIPAEVPEIHPGILAGYLKPEVLPNSLALIPPPLPHPWVPTPQRCLGYRTSLSR